ncbi:MAG: NADH-quinone oxidoreductase subunit NuoH [Fimbriimonadaceae bacterium]|nr:NADH-quinone oxidoreductase subunit NuoH [Fimbriimonadaceae bacterium]
MAKGGTQTARAERDWTLVVVWIGIAAVVLLVVGVVLGRLSGAVPHLQAWWQAGPSLTGLVEHLLVNWVGAWNWPASLAWLRPHAGWVAPVTAVLAWVVLIFLFMLPMVTYQIYALRKVVGFMQARVGPTQVGPWGLLQTPADVLKLLTKEDVIPRHADRIVFTIAPFLVLVPASMAYLVIPFGNQQVVDGKVVYSLIGGDLNVGLLYLSAISSVAVIGIIAAGWASNNKYSLLGGMRSAAQLITYEIPLTLAVVPSILWVGSLNLNTIAQYQDHLGNWLVWPCFPGLILFAISALSELGHVPFDLPEAESELVSGYNVEYSGMKFAMFFLAEFSNAFILSALGVTLFLGGWQSPFPESVPLLGWDHGIFAVGWFFLKTLSCVFFLFWLRATLPRLRIDQLMSLGWKILIPVGLLNVLLVAVLRVVLG